MQCSGSETTAQQDLQPAVRALFTDPLDTGLPSLIKLIQSYVYSLKNSLSDSSGSRPRLLWSLYYNVDLHCVDHTHQSGPHGLYLTSEPDTSIGYEKAANEVAPHVYKLFSCDILVATYNTVWWKMLTGFQKYSPNSKWSFYVTIRIIITLSSSLSVFYAGS